MYGKAITVNPLMENSSCYNRSTVLLEIQYLQNYHRVLLNVMLLKNLKRCTPLLSLVEATSRVPYSFQIRLLQHFI